MTQLELLERTAGEMAAQSDHVLRLLAALDNRPQDWEYRDEMGEDRSGKAQCACGHPIIYLFPVYDTKNPGQQRTLGSTCIEHYGTYRPEDAARMVAAQAAHEERLAAAKREAKRSAGLAQVQEAVARWEPYAESISEYWTRRARTGERIPDALYWHTWPQPGKMAGTLERRYKRPCDMLRYVADYIRHAERALRDAGAVTP